MEVQQGPTHQAGGECQATICWRHGRRARARPQVFVFLAETRNSAPLQQVPRQARPPWGDEGSIEPQRDGSTFAETSGHRHR